MLPTVSAGSAALTKYAQAVAIAAPEEAPRDSDSPARPEQEAARQNADKQPVPVQAQDALARDAGATVDAVLDLLRVRVLTALTGLGTAQEIANKAADAATVQLASAFAGESRHAAEIVHALLEQVQSGQGSRPDRLLQFAARGLVIVIDHVSGEVRVTPPQFDLTSNGAPPRAIAPPHLLDFTDYSAHQAAPVLQALGAVHATASAAIDRVGRAADAHSPAAVQTSPFVVAPNAFVQPLTAQLQAVLPENTLVAPEEAAKTISRVLSQAILGAVNAGGTPSVSVGEIMMAARQLQPVPAAIGDEADPARANRVTLSAGKISVAVDTGGGPITVQIGNRTTAIAPVSAPAPGVAIPALPGLDTAPLPTAEFSSRRPVGEVLDKPVGIPFVPPAFDDPPPAVPQVPGGSPGQTTPPAPGSKPSAHAAMAVDEAFRQSDPTILRNATVLRSLGPVAGSDIPALTRIALDIAGEIAPGAPVAVNPPHIGKFGLPKPAPVQSEDGPVLRHGYADATANLPPVLPAVHQRGQTDIEDRKPRQKAKAAQKQLPGGRYETVALDDAFTRDMPADHQGLVFSSVVFSV